MESDTNKPKRLGKKLAVIDFETDPFKWGREPKPFAAGFYDGERYIDFWGRNCAEKLGDFIQSLEDPHYIYAHNGGKFDFHFLLQLGILENPVKIINGRIVAASIGEHELRDSYAILPVPLRAYAKDEINYSWFEKDVREKHRDTILEYLAHDCEYLFDLVKSFLDRFGLNLTIGGTAIKKLSEFHPFEKTYSNHDVKFRQFYFGGRVQCFEHGILKGKFKVYDVNSMYPHVMRNIEHPIGTEYFVFTGGMLDDGTLSVYGDRPYFAHIIAKNRGALPIRTKNGLDFTQEYGEFFACSHEIKVAIKHGLLDIDKVIKIHVPQRVTTFANYVDAYIQEKIDGKKEGNKTKELFAKLLLNSAYGKFGQNPEHYHDYFLVYMDEKPPEKCELYLDFGGVEIWRKPVTRHVYYDVAVAASVTSASRAVLMDALQHAKFPVYCDTDSIICAGLSNVRLDDSELGAWKLEGYGTKIAIAGKKLYALINKGETIKIASKGVVMTADDIFKVANGGEFHYRHDAPNFKLSGEVKFTDRRVKRTKK